MTRHLFAILFAIAAAVLFVLAFAAEDPLTPRIEPIAGFIFLFYAALFVRGRP